MNKQKIFSALKVIAIPTLYAVALRLFFGIETWRDLFSVMSVSFLFCLPTIVGALTVYFSSEANARKFSYKFFVPWIPIFIFLLITLALALEGWACWLMVLPLSLIAASAGGIIGAYLKFRKQNKKTYVSILILMPIFIAPIESFIGAIPGTYKAYTYIDIQASQDKIWSNVTRVREIKEAQDKGWLTRYLGFPRPVKAELNFEGVGAYREAKFTNWIVFHESVSEYVERRKWCFQSNHIPTKSRLQQWTSML